MAKEAQTLILRGLWVISGGLWVDLEKLKELGIEIIAPPTDRPWGARNMTFSDPDGNHITFRSFPKQRPE